MSVFLGLRVQADVLRFRNQLADNSKRCDLAVSNNLYLLSSVRSTRLFLVEVPVDRVLVLTRLKDSTGASPVTLIALIIFNLHGSFLLQPIAPC